jgi:2-polyprenyl-3-methyl-5-hydroxy-6-metoxy-1,4-benzoquinol methylase
MQNKEHRILANNFLKGKGLEIGALHEPAQLPISCSVEYCDVISKEKAIELFPEINKEAIPEVKYICDLNKDGLSMFADEQFDFVILSHVIEHLANPIKVVRELFRITKTNGIVLIAAPDKNYTFDKNRKLTSYAHLFNEYKENVTEVSDEHYIDFLKGVHPEVFQNNDQKLKEIIHNVRTRREHAHVWNSESFKYFMEETLKRLNIDSDCLYESTGKENKIEFLSVWKKLSSKNKNKISLFEKIKNVFAKTHSKNKIENVKTSTHNILDSYIMSYPSHQNAINIFAKEWSSKIPPTKENFLSGEADLFNDGRIFFADQEWGGFEGTKVLELGPLEGGHSYMLEKKGAASILAIEANAHAYLKCLIVKEIHSLNHTHFLLGNFVEYLKYAEQKFDICIASGVLYHMVEPAELLMLIAQKTEKLLLWTHYFDEELLQNNPHGILSKFEEGIYHDYNGFEHTLHKYNYDKALEWAGFCGGSNTYSFWMERNDILELLKRLGFVKISISFDDPNHPNGPSFCIAASK